MTLAAGFQPAIPIKYFGTSGTDAHFALSGNYGVEGQSCADGRFYLGIGTPEGKAAFSGLLTAFALGTPVKDIVFDKLTNVYLSGHECRVTRIEYGQ